jgi:thioredoxin 1
MITYLTELTKDNFYSFIKNSLTLVDIGAEWCGPCRMISPIVDEISNEYYGKISIGKLDVDSCPEITNELGIRNIPALLLYKDGEIVDKLIGAVNKKTITSLIDKYIS